MSIKMYLSQRRKNNEKKIFEKIAELQGKASIN